MFARLVLAVLLLVAACGDTTSTIATTTTPAPTVTHTLAPATSVVGMPSPWEPAHLVPATALEALEASLLADGAWMLLPAEAPVEGPTSAEVVTRTPMNDPSAVGYDVVVRPAGTGRVILFLGSFPSDDDACAGLTGYEPVEVRGSTGCALLVDGGVDFLRWSEDGRNFHAEWDDMAPGDVIGWLDEWRRIP